MNELAEFAIRRILVALLIAVAAAAAAAPVLVLPALLPAPLLLASALGVGSHVLMDLANSYGVRLLLPWSDRWLYGDLWVIVDPWLWLILGGSVFMTAPAGRRRTLAWSLGAAVLLSGALSACVPLMVGGAVAGGSMVATDRRTSGIQLEDEGIGCRPLRTSHAFHSQMMAPVVAPFLAAVSAVKLSAPTLPLVIS